jgi:hypothetical protein
LLVLHCWRAGCRRAGRCAWTPWWDCVINEAVSIPHTLGVAPMRR